MKKKIIILNALLLGGLVTSISAFNNKASYLSVHAVNGCVYASSLPTTIDLNDCSDEEIRNYYSSLNSLNENELKGENLLKNLKPILFNMNYYSYANVWKIYEITDRNWDKSPAGEDEYGNYNSSTNKISGYSYGTSASNSKNNPYLHLLYIDPNEEEYQLRAWEKHGNGIDREHIWCQSRGFKADSGAEGPAGTDVHHLVAADSDVNQTHHNNNPYGYVNVENTTTHNINVQKPYLAGNKKGTAVHKFPGSDKSSDVFEPQDSDKGDIARACFYMVARYNNLSGHDTISQYEPNLTLVNYATSGGAKEDSSATKAVGMGILQDLLEWNKLDPVDEYEIHRNNLIYRNYQGNRNPFIDFPEWADYIWGTCVNGTYDSTPTSYAKPTTDKIAKSNISINYSTLSVKPNTTKELVVTTKDNSDITWSITSGSEFVTLDKISSHSGEAVTVTMGENEGSAVITASATVEGEPVSVTCNITISKTAGEQRSIIDVLMENKVLLYVGIGLIAIILIVAIIVYNTANKKQKKQMAKTAKKVAKSAIKGAKTTSKKK